MTDSVSSRREQLKSHAAKYSIQIVNDDAIAPRIRHDRPIDRPRQSGSGNNLLGTNPGPAVITRAVKQLGIKLLFAGHRYPPEFINCR
jgi:branched-chain amino acid transport system substrate-binding protein